MYYSSCVWPNLKAPVHKDFNIIIIKTIKIGEQFYDSILEEAYYI